MKQGYVLFTSYVLICVLLIACYVVSFLLPSPFPILPLATNPTPISLDRFKDFLSPDVEILLAPFVDVAIHNDVMYTLRSSGPFRDSITLSPLTSPLWASANHPKPPWEIDISKFAFSQAAHFPIGLAIPVDDAIPVDVVFVYLADVIAPRNESFSILSVQKFSLEGVFHSAMSHTIPTPEVKLEGSHPRPKFRIEKDKLLFFWKGRLFVLNSGGVSWVVGPEESFNAVDFDVFQDLLVFMECGANVYSECVLHSYNVSSRANPLLLRSRSSFFGYRRTL